MRHSPEPAAEHEIMAPFHFFTDIDSLGSQSAADAFGPVSGASDTQFLVTSIHRPAASEAPNAYAVCDGLLLAQDAGNDRLNLVLKPIQQPPFAFPKIKFFIYRGIQKSSLVDGSDVAPETNNDLTKSIWQSQKARNASAGTSDNAPAEALGLDISGSGSIEQVFYREDVSYQLPLVRSGWSLGELDPAGFGFEIMVEAIGFDPELPIARTAKNVITVTPLPASPTQAQEFEYWHDKEAILTYIDPCAFFGAFYSHTLKVKHADASVTKAKKNEVYDEALKGAHLPAAGDGVFFNRNRTYLDIRNEYNHSLNYFKNYGAYSNTTINCAFDASAAMTARNYYASTWPLMFVDNGDLPAGNTSATKNVVRIALPDGAGDNPFPTLYISAGYLNNLYPREPKGNAKLIDLTPSAGFTEEVALAIPNRDGLSTTTTISSYIKLKYFKRFDPEAASPPASSETVIRAANYLDQLFACVDVSTPHGVYSARSTIQEDEAFVDARAVLNSTFLQNIGRAESTLNVTLFAFATIIRNAESDALHRGFSLSGKAKKPESEFLRDLQSEYPNLLLGRRDLHIGTATVSILEYATASEPSPQFTEPNPANLWALVLTASEFESIHALTNDTTKFSPRFRVYVGVRDKASAIDDQQLPYTTFELVLRGYKLNAASYEITEERTLVTHYSHGNI